jgi:hypothetical protein
MVGGGDLSATITPSGQNSDGLAGGDAGQADRQRSRARGGDALRDGGAIARCDNADDWVYWARQD